jgi:hypothetical protein
VNIANRLSFQHHSTPTQLEPNPPTQLNSIRASEAHKRRSVPAQKQRPAKPQGSLPYPTAVLLDESVQTEGYANAHEEHSYEQEPCLEQTSLEVVHRSIIRQRL